MERDVESLLQEAAGRPQRSPNVAEIRHRGLRRRRVVRAGTGLLSVLLIAGGVGAATQLDFERRPNSNSFASTSGLPSEGIVLAPAARDGSDNDSLVVIDPDTGETTPLLPQLEARGLQAPAWSPDGQRVAFAMNVVPGHPDYIDANHEIFVADLDGGEIRRLTHHEDLDTEPVWSPDGRQIAFTRWFDGVPESQGASRVFVVDLTSGDARELAAPQGSSASPDWSPDGAWLAYNHTDRGTHFSIFKQRPEGGEATRLTAPPGIDIGPQWSPDGQLIAFTRMAEAAGSSNRTVLAVTPEGDERKLFSDSGYAPVWSPAGDALAYVSSETLGGTSPKWAKEEETDAGRNGLEQVVIVDLDEPENRFDVGPGFDMVLGGIDWR
jgi:Tol biopolymer transport system component